MKKPWVWIALGGVVVVFVAGLLIRRAPTTHRAGEVYWRVPIADSTVISTVRAASGDDPRPGDLLISALAYGVRVRIEYIDSCEHILAAYDALPAEESILTGSFVTPMPLYDDDHKECFAYRVRFDVPVDMEGQTELMPLSIALIHPMEDIGLLLPL